MKSPACEMLEIEFPLFAFTHCRDVVVEVSKAGGLGVLGAVGFSPRRLEIELKWIDEHIDGKPYGVDLIVPAKFETQRSQETGKKIVERIPQTHKDFARDLLARYSIDAEVVSDDRLSHGTVIGDNMADSGALASLDVAFSHPIRMIVNALGPPPSFMLERAKREGVPVGALAGTRDHAIRNAEAGADIIIAAGGEAGGHCGDVSTMVLVPEVVDAMRDFDDLPVLAAGGIATGRQMAACMAMGAAGAWTGSVWLTTTEAETSPVVKEKMLAAGARDTIRSRSRTGKHARQLRSAWTDAWEGEGAPTPLPMPFQSVISEPCLHRVERLAEGGHEGARELASYFVGQGVGLMNKSVDTRWVVQEFMEDFADAYDRLQNLLSD